MIDSRLILAVQADLEYLAGKWDELEARLEPGGGNALSGMPRGGGESAPIRISVSDVRLRIQRDLAQTYAHMLMDDTADTAHPWQPREPGVKGMLRGIAEYAGHFFVGQPQIADEFMEIVADCKRKADAVLTPPEPPRYFGECPTDLCEGELYLRPGRTVGRCRECGREWTEQEQREFIGVKLQDRLMTLSELRAALVTLGHRVTYEQVKKWAQRKLIVSVDMDLYRLTDAIEVAVRMATRRRAS